MTPGLRPSSPHPQKPTERSRPFAAILTLFGAPAGRSVFSLPAGPDANVEKDGSSASLTAMSDSPGGCLRAGRGTEAGVRGPLSTAAQARPTGLRPSPLPAPRAAPTSLMWGPGRSSGVRSSGGTQTPKSTKRKKKKNLKTKPKPKTPNCPRSFFGLNINARCLFKKFLCIQKFLEKL